jgi:hypothetical protein
MAISSSLFIQSRRRVRRKVADIENRPQKLQLAQDCSIRQAVPSVRRGGAIPHCYCWPAVNAGCSFEYLIGEIIGHEGFVNLVKIASIILHYILPKICPLFLLSVRWTRLAAKVRLRDRQAWTGAAFGRQDRHAAPSARRRPFPKGVSTRSTGAS